MSTLELCGFLFLYAALTSRPDARLKMLSACKST